MKDDHYLKEINHIDDDFRSHIYESEHLDHDQLTKHVYACFGIAMYFAQCLEIQVKCILLWHSRSLLTQHTEEAFDNIDQDINQRTLGSLFRYLRESVDVESGIEKNTTIALKRRNFLAHSFFYDRAESLLSTKGLMDCVHELMYDVQIFRNADKSLTPIFEAVLIKNGATLAAINRLASEALQKEKDRLADN